MNPRPAPDRSPLLPEPGPTAYGDLPAPAPHTAPELAALLRLLADHRRPPLHGVAIGHSRDDASRAAAAAFADAWQAAGHAVLAVVDWPEQAASWLRPAHRLTAPEPDALVIAAAPLGWAQLARRLRHSTPWRPDRTFGFASLAEPVAAALAGPGVLDGVRGAGADGGTWRIASGWTDSFPPTTPGAAT
ncbi:hypothetical protein DR950_06225 [Kitasatospora xanthocidica]|uniref:Leucine-binding protein domain-containing protein n=1 Tax=Kitasatospora xanthocidica TaxID=83382 RepID=A0A372ZPF5_9ACTN|nr:hypothetical protein [Kitasatospora xanthocidica]RGD57444.1 hypothetical protein DR950_06225 [Kitasatospora xanthocidica]